MNWSPRRDVIVKGGRVVHLIGQAGHGWGVRECGTATLQEVALEDFGTVHSGEPARLRALVCEHCGAILAVISAVRP